MFAVDRWGPWLVMTLLLLPLVHLAWWTEGGGSSTASGLETNERQARPDMEWETLGRTVLVSAVAATVAVGLAACMAWLVTSSGLPWKPLWATLLLIPLACPPAVWALGRIYALGPGGFVPAWLGGLPWPRWLEGEVGRHVATILVLSEVHAPLAMLVLARGFAALPRRGWASARLYLSGLPLGRWLVGALRGELLGAWLVTFLLGLGNFAVPHVMQCRLYAIQVYARLTNYLDPRGAVESAVPLLAIALVAAAGAALALRCELADASRPAAETPEVAGWRTWVVAGLLALYALLTTGLTLAALLTECGSVANFREAVAEAGPETGQTLLIGTGAACLGAACGGIVGTWVARRGSLAAELLALAPLGVPTLIVGLAYSRFFNASLLPSLSWIGDTSLLVILGLGFRVWPFATRITTAGQRRVPGSWREAAQLAGIRRWPHWFWIRLPLSLEFVLTGALLGFVLAVGDVEISQMLCAPGSGTLSLRLFTFLHFGPRHVAASLALLLMGLSLVPVFAFFLLTNRFPRWF